MARITAFQNRNTGAYFRIGNDEEIKRLEKLPHMVKGYEEDGRFVPIDKTEMEQLKEDVALREAALQAKQEEIDSLNGEIARLTEALNGASAEMQAAIAAQNNAAIAELQGKMSELQKQIAQKNAVRTARQQNTKPAAEN